MTFLTAHYAVGGSSCNLWFFWRNCPHSVYGFHGADGRSVCTFLSHYLTLKEGTAGKVEDLGLSCLASALFSRRPLRDSSSDSAVRFFPTACLVLPSPARLGPLLQFSPALAHGSMKRGVVEVVAAAAAAGRRQEQEERRWRRRWWWRRRWLG